MKMIIALKSLKNIVIQSFYKKDLYRNVVYNWKGYGQKYLLILCLIASIPTILFSGALLDDIYDILGDVLQLHDKAISNTDKQEAESAKFINDLLTQVPEFIVKNDRISANNDAPFIIKSNVLDKNIVLIDTKPGSTPKNEYMVNVNDTSISFGEITLDLTPHVQGIQKIVNSDTIYEYIRSFYKASVSSFMTIIFASVGYFIAAIYFKLIVNLIGMFLLNKFSKLGFNKEQVFRIVSISASPAIVILSGFNLVVFLSYFLFKNNMMGANYISTQSQIFSLVSLGYLFYGFISIKHQHLTKN
ncbi:MAG: DUF1189 family protein [Alphaproteobacteria bacterium]|nr:DUF1189 family protein [Alphaproteobacteria bacterium]OJV15305.1 MAG: hypothetical protein BGO27_02220 [Alphaproteobacteria bacterium 33-17]